MGESPPQTLCLVAPRSPAGPGRGTFSSKHRAGNPRGRGLMAGTQQAGRASWPGLPQQLAPLPSLHRASSPRLLAPCHARLGRVSRWGPSHRLKLLLPGLETPSPVPSPRSALPGQLPGAALLLSPRALSTASHSPLIRPSCSGGLSLQSYCCSSSVPATSCRGWWWWGRETSFYPNPC